MRLARRVLPRKEATVGNTSILASRGIYNTQQKPALDALQHGESMLYAMRVDDGLIKIGCSRDIAKRRQWLVGEILALKPGDFDDEREIHRSLTAHVHHGREWYNPTPEVLAVVNELRRYFKLQPIDA